MNRYYFFTQQNHIKKQLLVLLNLNNKTVIANTGLEYSKTKLLLSNDEKPAADGILLPYQAAIYEL